MAHPPLEEILRGTPAANEHLASCRACRALAMIADAPEAAFPDDTVDRERYVDWKPLAEGGGGMGRIFRAHDRRLGRDVVIKQPLATESGFDLRARFEREALITARLQHPSIVGVYEAGRFGDGEPFFAMPLVPGAPLSDEIAKRTTLEQRLALLGNVTSVCEAVAYAHDQGFIHRDIKPANIIIGSFGETVVLDWGLASEVAGATEAHAPTPIAGDGLTQLGVGTAPYMPPEQAVGATPGPRMDVYALGATLYHLLAGAPPYGRMDSAGARDRLLAEPPPPLASIAPQVPLPLCDIVARAMARDPAGRFETARELAEELRRFQTGQLVQSRRYGPAEIVRHFARRYRAPLIVAGIAVVLVAAATVTSAIRIARAGRAATAAHRRAEDNERQSRRELQRGLGVSASRLALVPTRRLDALALAVDAVTPELAAGRPPVHEAMQGLVDAISAGPPAVVLDANTTVIRRFAFSRDGSRLATESPVEHAVHVWNGHTGELLRTAASGGAHFSVRGLTFSPDASTLVTWGENPPQAQRWPLDGGRAITLAVDGAIAGADFLRDGTLVLAGTTVRWLRADGVELQRRPLPARAASFATTPDRVAVATIAGDVLVWDASGRLLATVSAPAVSALALSSDGARLALRIGDVVEIRDLARPTEVRTRVELGTDVGADAVMAFRDRVVSIVDPTGRSIVIDVDADRAQSIVGTTLVPGAAWSAAPGVLRLHDTSTLAPMHSIDGPPGLAIEALAVDPGSRLVVATDRTTWLVDARTAELGALVGHTSEISGLATVDGTLVTAGLDGRVILWSERGTPAAVVPFESEVLVMTAAGTRVVVGTADGAVTAIETAPPSRGTRTTLVAGTGSIVGALEPSPDHQVIVAARDDGELVCVDLATTAATSWLPRGAAVTTAIAFSPDGALAATGHVDGTVQLWRLARGPGCAAPSLVSTTALRDREAGRVKFMLVFTPDGRLLASRNGLDTAVLGTSGLERVGSMEGRLLTTSRDRTLIATRVNDGAIIVHAGTRSTRLAIPRRATVAAGFSPSGRTLILGDVDGVVRTIDVTAALAGETDVALEIASAGAGAVSAIGVSPDGQSVIAGHAGGTLRSHPLTAAAALRRACTTLAGFGRTPAGCVTVP